MTRRRIWLALALAWTVLQFEFNDRTLEAQEAAPSEFQLKAVFLYNFAKFVDWPPGAFASPNDPFIIGVAGEDPFGPYLDDAVRNKTIGSRPFVVRHVRLIGDERK